MNGMIRKINRLLSEVQCKQPPETVFTLEDGSTFTTELDPMTYLLQYGATERGRIAGYEPPSGMQDPITAAVYSEIRRLVLANPALDGMVKE